MKIKISQCETVTDPKKFVESHEAIVAAHPGEPRYKPYLERLEAFRVALASGLHTWGGALINTDKK